MTVGTFALMVLETAPIRPSATDLAAVELSPRGPGAEVFRTEVPVQAIKWRNIVVHASVADRREMARRYHFLIGPDTAGAPDAVRATSLWKHQAEGYHVYIPGYDYNADSIGICLVGDFSRSGPSGVQFRALVSLVQTLQRACGISADHVYLHSDLDAVSRSPGEAFPVEAFTARLLRPRR